MRFTDSKTAGENIYTPDQGEVALRRLWLLDELDHLAVQQLGHAKHLGIRDTRQQDLGGRVVRLVNSFHELRNPLIQKIVAEIHHEGFRAEEPLTNQHGMRQPARRVLFNVRDTDAPRAIHHQRRS